MSPTELWGKARVGDGPMRRHPDDVTPPRPAHAPLKTSVLGSLIPFVAFLGVSLADLGLGSLLDLIVWSPFYFGFVALPSLLPLAAARRGAVWLAALFLMTLVALVAGLAMVTSDDAQAGLAVLVVAYVALPLAGVLWLGDRVAWRRTEARRAQEAEFGAAQVSDRLAALAIDVVILGAALLAPLSAISDAKHEVAAGALGIGTATVYQTLLISLWGGTVGQLLLGLRVVDVATGRRVAMARLLARGAIVALEVEAVPTVILAAPAIAELVSAGAGGSLTDRLLGTNVVSIG